MADNPVVDKPVTEESVLLLEDVFNLNDSLEKVIDHLKKLTERGILRWGTDHRGATLLGVASGQGVCGVILTRSNIIVKGLTFKHFRLQAINCFRSDYLTFSEKGNIRPDGPISDFFHHILSQARSRPTR